MSQAFMRDREEMWLHDVAPTMNALIVYLTRENNGIPVTEKKNYFSEDQGREVHEMSDGLTYAIGDNSKWYLVEKAG